MSVIYVLLVAHFIADFVCQSDWVASNKSKRWDALAWHVGIYVFVVSGLIAAAFNHHLVSAPAAKSMVLQWIVVNFAAHFVQDAITSRINARLWFLKLTPAVKGWRVLDSHPDLGTTSREETAYWLDDLGTRHWFFVGIGFDQLLHYVTLFVTAHWWLA